MSTVVLYCWCHSDSASVLLYILYFTLASIWLQYSFTIYIQVYIIILALNAKDILINIITPP